MRTSKNNELLTSAQAAKLLGFTPDYIRRLIMEGKLEAIKPGHDWLVTMKAISKIKRQRFPKKKEEGNDAIRKTGSSKE